jgi:hypothetical protein
MINALFVETDGVYFDLPGVIPWDVNANAFNCTNGYPAIAHPPCGRWGRYWSGGPSAKIRKKMGDDNGCFAFALWYVRTYGGVIEHPEASHAWPYWGLTKPPKSGGWVKADNYGGLTCCVEQGHYGHRARKATWLYINKIEPKELIWGKAEGKMPLEESFRSTRDRKYYRDMGAVPGMRISKEERLATPIPFRNLLLEMMGVKVEAESIAS